MEMQATQARIAQIMQSMRNSDAKSSREEVKFNQEQIAAQEMQDSAQSERDQAVGIIDRLLSDENRGSLESATGSLQGRLPSVRQGTVDWENDFAALNSLLTLDNLDRMSGVLSESDIKLLREAATGGLNLTSGDEAVVRRLNQIRAALAGGQVEQQAPQAGGFRIVAEE
jgi:hypothetical protein